MQTLKRQGGGVSALASTPNEIFKTVEQRPLLSKSQVAGGFCRSEIISLVCAQSMFACAQVCACCDLNYKGRELIRGQVRFVIDVFVVVVIAVKQGQKRALDWRELEP